jgi:myo-inositol catabolism protein IolC
MPEMIDSTITYDSPIELKEIILELVSNREKVNSLKTLALKNALKFTPEAIYAQLNKQ